MRTTVMAAAGIVILAAGGAALAQDDDDAAAVDELTEARLAAAHDYMEGVVEPTAEELWNSVGWIIDATGEHDLSPQNDEEWAAARQRAVAVQDVAEGLKTATFAWDEPEWRGYAQGVVDAAGLSVTAAEHQSVEEMFDAGQVLDEACESCHLHYDPDAAPPPDAL